MMRKKIYFSRTFTVKARTFNCATEKNALHKFTLKPTLASKRKKYHSLKLFGMNNFNDWPFGMT